MTLQDLVKTVAREDLHDLLTPCSVVVALIVAAKAWNDADTRRYGEEIRDLISALAAQSPHLKTAVTTIGFTGTRNGMTIAQMRAVFSLVTLFKTRGATKARHGVCKMADDQFHVIARKHGLHIIGHPGVNVRGECPGRGLAICDEVLPEQYFLDRNHDIVDDSDVLIAAPKSDSEETRGGTWATIRYARKISRRVIIVWPDGTLKDNTSEVVH